MTIIAPILRPDVSKKAEADEHCESLPLLANWASSASTYETNFATRQEGDRPFHDAACHARVRAGNPQAGLKATKKLSPPSHGGRTEPRAHAMTCQSGPGSNEPAA